MIYQNCYHVIVDLVAMSLTNFLIAVLDYPLEKLTQPFCRFDSPSEFENLRLELIYRELNDIKKAFL